MFAVLGVTGHTGKVVAERLLAQGAGVRVVVRDAAKGAPWAARGAEVAVADVGDAEALSRAFAGVAGAYVLLPPDPVATDFVALQKGRADAVAAALAAAKVQHVVLLSSVAAQFPDGTGPIKTVHYAEKVFAGATPRRSYLRAAYFMENVGGSLGALKDGIYPSFIRADIAADMVATADIGRVGADLLLSGGVEGTQIVELSSGPHGYTAGQIAEILGKLVGRPIQLVSPPLAAVVPTFTSFGMSENVAGLYLEMLTAFNAGGDPWEHSGWTVRGPTKLEDVLAGMLAGG